MITDTVRDLADRVEVPDSVKGAVSKVEVPSAVRDAVAKVEVPSVVRDAVSNLDVPGTVRDVVDRVEVPDALREAVSKVDVTEIDPVATTRSGLPVLVGSTRAATGVAFLAAPDRCAQVWVDRSSIELRYFMRVIGVRDLVLGAGTLVALARDADPVPWLAAGAACDVVDAAAGAAMLPSGPAKKTLAVGLGFAALGVAAISAVRGR